MTMSDPDEYKRGFDDAFDGRRQNPPPPGKLADQYYRGFKAGYDAVIKEREEMDRSGSSNA